MASSTETTVTMAFSVPSGGLTPYTHTLQMDSGSGFSDLAVVVDPAEDIVVEGLDFNTTYGFRVKTQDSLSPTPQTVFSNELEVTTDGPPEILNDSLVYADSLLVEEDSWTNEPWFQIDANQANYAQFLNERLAPRTDFIHSGSEGYARFSAPELRTPADFSDALFTLSEDFKLQWRGSMAIGTADRAELRVQLTRLTAGGSIDGFMHLRLFSDGTAEITESLVSTGQTGNSGLSDGVDADFLLEWDSGAKQLALSIDGTEIVSSTFSFSELEANLEMSFRMERNSDSVSTDLSNMTIDTIAAYGTEIV